MSGRPSRLGALRYRGYLLFWLARFLAVMAALIVSVAVGWQIYDLTHSPFQLGLVGLVQFAPALLLVLVTGTVADRFNRRVIMALCQIGEGLCAGTLVFLTVTDAITAPAIFIILTCLGVVRAFFNPASQSLLANLVPPEDLASAIAWSSSSRQVATIVGPVTGGLLYGLGPAVPYATAVVFVVTASILLFLVPRPPQIVRREPPSWTTFVAGFHYMWHEKIVLGATTLDMFAVLLGGATALLPAYARDILSTGPWGLGLLRSAPAIGALTVALTLAVRPIRNHAGIIMFSAVALFGLATLVFGLSRTVWLSVAALAVMGAADMISVFIRQTLIQLWTPDAVRGRVTAVNTIFVGASNELGEFRAGTVAALIGVIPAVVIGGIGTVAVALIWSRLFPQLRNANHLDGSP
jgi:MFS family permease